jgi:CRP/FNR family cyclic AMP-dependent transcriptional regulator
VSLTNRAVCSEPGMPLKLRLSRRQQQVLLALYRSYAFGEREALPVRMLVARRELADRRYAGPLAGLEEAGLVASHREFAKTNWRSFSSWWLTDEGCRAASMLGASDSGGETVPETVRVLEADGALGAGLAPEDRAAACERAVAHTLTLERGTWSPEAGKPDWRSGLGLLVLEGLLSREVKVKSRTAFEVFGPRDLLRPWNRSGPLSAAPVPATWEVLTAARLAVLDRQFAAGLASWPEVTGALVDRALQNSHSLAVQSAVRQGGSVEERLLLMLWHLAHRWGELGEDDVVLRLPGLSPAVLARMVATTPEPAVDALKRMEERGSLKQVSGRGWWLALRRVPVGPEGIRKVGHAFARMLRCDIAYLCSSASRRATERASSVSG